MGSEGLSSSGKKLVHADLVEGKSKEYEELAGGAHSVARLGSPCYRTSLGSSGRGDTKVPSRSFGKQGGSLGGRAGYLELVPEESHDVVSRDAFAMIQKEQAINQKINALVEKPS